MMAKPFCTGCSVLAKLTVPPVERTFLWSASCSREYASWPEQLLLQESVHEAPMYARGQPAWSINKSGGLPCRALLML